MAMYPIFANQLNALGHGRAMWVPEGETHLGDVGVFEHESGRFVALFNIFLPADHPRNVRGVPHGFEPLSLDSSMYKTVPSYLKPGPLHSISVQERTVESSLGQYHQYPPLSFVEGQTEFYCTGSSGAITYLYDEADKEYLLPNTVYADYMARHYSSWHGFAELLGYDVDRNGDMGLVMICAAVKTSKCSMGVWRNSNELGNSKAPPFEQRSCAASCPSLDDDSQSPPRDKTIFVSFYKMKMQVLLGPKVVETPARSRRVFWRGLSSQPGSYLSRAGQSAQ